MNQRANSRRLGAVVVMATVLAGGGCGASGGSGGSSGSSKAPGSTTTLDLKAGGNAYDVTKCGVTHHYTTYAAEHRIEYGAQLSPPPPGRWTAKVKIKRCAGTAFSAVAATHASGTPTGYVSGFLSRVPGGFYFARLYYYTGRKTAAESDKEYFRVG